MTRYFLNRLVQLIPTILGIYTFAFLLMRVLPGDAANVLAGFRDDQVHLENLRRTMKLDEPIFNQYVGFLQSALVGDFGNSYITGQPVTEMIGDAFPLTVLLAAVTMLLAVMIGVPLGIVAAVWQDSIWDSVSRLLALLGVSIPVFWLGIQFQVLFGLQLKWLPVSGVGFDKHIVLPAITACGATLALLMRMTRASLLDELHQDYARTARGKGLRERSIIWIHVLRNALLPVVTVWGGSLANLLSGTLLVEIIFSWPGMGRLLLQAINTRDYPLLQAIVIILALLYAGMNLLVDLSYPLIDPRIRYGQSTA
ncbi:MAG TPA: ABC transporter permease [Aggregatilineales bacterium]|nr:ABC transporter permease [Aggregatilineales bacterium]